MLKLKYRICLLLIIILACNNPAEVDTNSNDFSLETSNEMEKLISAESILDKKKQKSDSIEIDYSKIDTLNLDDIHIIIKEEYPIKNSYFSCNSYVITLNGNDTIDYVEFKAIEALGGNAGFSNSEIISNHVILGKQGDYDGRTLVVNTNGQIFNFIGGTNFIDRKQAWLFSLYSLDLPGCAVFDLNNDSLLFEMDDTPSRPLGVHKAVENRYFFYCSQDNTLENSIWEFEADLQRIMQVDLDSTDVNSSTELEMINVFRF